MHECTNSKIYHLIVRRIAEPSGTGLFETLILASSYSRCHTTRASQRRSGSSEKDSEGPTMYSYCCYNDDDDDDDDYCSYGYQ